MPETNLVVVDPGHFHATLVQQQMYPELSPLMRVYALLGPDLIDYLSRISGDRKRLPTGGSMCMPAPIFSTGYGMSRRVSEAPLVTRKPSP